MARKSLTGQLNMFDFFKNLEDGPMGEVQMVSLMPDEEPSIQEETPKTVLKPKTNPTPKKPRKPKIIEPVVQEPVLEEVSVENSIQEEPVPVENAPVRVELSSDRPVMSRQYEIEGSRIEIAYINYNKVRICRSGEEPEIKEFASSKEAVDYYVQKMQELEPEE